LPAELCEQIRVKFNDSHTSRGVAGGGVDLQHKDSHDVDVTQNPDWAGISQQVMDHTTVYLSKYMIEFAHLLTGAISNSKTDPQTGQTVKLRADSLTPAEATALMMKLYRPGNLIAQEYKAGVGGYHHWHSEIFPMDASCETLHRVLLFMFYINTLDEGGETEFFYQEQKIAPKAGRMVIAPADFTHTHKGHVPVSDDKLIITSWILFNRSEHIYG
ncbi:MAG: 2OG-Fe(II) oxygenase, partial [Planctomycetota bacterium]